MKAAKKNTRRLKRRQAAWEEMKADQMYGPETKIVRDMGGVPMAYRRPGSQKK